MKRKTAPKAKFDLYIDSEKAIRQTSNNVKISNENLNISLAKLFDDVALVKELQKSIEKVCLKAENQFLKKFNVKCTNAKEATLLTEKLGSLLCPIAIQVIANAIKINPYGDDDDSDTESKPLVVDPDGSLAKKN